MFYRCDSTKKLQSELKNLKSLISDPVIFKKMYRYAFDFCRVCGKPKWSHICCTSFPIKILNMWWFILYFMYLNYYRQRFETRLIYNLLYLSLYLNACSWQLEIDVDKKKLSIRPRRERFARMGYLS